MVCLLSFSSDFFDLRERERNFVEGGMAKSETQRLLC